MCCECLCSCFCSSCSYILFLLVDKVCGLDRLSGSEFEVDGPQTLSVSRKRGTSVALEREQHKRAKASMDTTPIQSMPVPNRTPVKAVPECGIERRLMLATVRRTHFLSLFQDL